MLVAAARPASAIRVAASHPRVTPADTVDLIQRAPLLVLAVPFPAALELMTGASCTGDGRVALDLTNPALGPGPPPPGIHRSAGETLAAALPTWRVVKASNSVPADMLTEPVLAIVALFALPLAAHAQQRPLVTEDPETIGADRILFETDYPHPVCLFGNVREKIDAGLAGQAPEIRRKLLWENAAKLYKVPAPDRPVPIA